jgi:hypothetical protein
MGYDEGQELGDRRIPDDGSAARRAEACGEVGGKNASTVIPKIQEERGRYP